MRRLLIYLTYDKQNIIDDYIGYFLRSIRPIVAAIAVVCNMPKIEKGRHHLSDYADNIFYRENQGLDAGGFKDALCRFIGWDKIRQFDELILANDSFYGPFDDISKIFNEMESRNLDFWGLMKRGAGTYGATGNDPEHLLSFFYVFQSPMFHSVEFREYWETMPYYRDYMTVVKKYERKLTSYFAAKGYTYDAYADTKPNETENLKNQFFQCDYLSYEMMAKRNFPFLKRKQLSYNTLYYQTQENLPLSMEHVDKHTDYDVDLIWKNLIRTQNPAKLQRSLGLQYILESGEKERAWNALVCVRAEWMNASLSAVEYLDRIHTVCTVQIFTASTEIKSFYQEKGFLTVLSEKSDMEILLESDTKKYHYICLLHDTDLSSDQTPSCTGKSYFFNIWENLVKDTGYIHSVLKLLHRKTYLGMLMHPVPIFSTWVGTLGIGWGNQFDAVKGCIEKLDLKSVIQEEIPPVHVTGNFWIKSEVIDAFSRKVCTSSCREDIPRDLQNYLWTYIVQDSGKLTGIVESTFYASLNETNQHYYVRTFLEWFTKQYGVHGKLQEFQELFFVQSAAEKCRNHYGKWYVYGTGEIAERCSLWIRDTDGFIVSDGQKKVETFQGKPVICLSELENAKEVGIVTCLSKENQDAVIPLLEEKGIRNYYTIY